MSYRLGEAGYGERAGSAVSVVLALIQAICDGRPEEVLRLVDPEVVYKPLDQSGPDMYRGHEGMRRLVQDLHAALGDYRVNIVNVTEEPRPHVTVQAWVVPGPGRGTQFPMRLLYTLRDGLVTLIQSIP